MSKKHPILPEGKPWQCKCNHHILLSIVFVIVIRFLHNTEMEPPFDFCDSFLFLFSRQNYKKKNPCGDRATWFITHNSFVTGIWSQSLIVVIPQTISGINTPHILEPKCEFGLPNPIEVPQRRSLTHKAPTIFNSRLALPPLSCRVTSQN